MIIFQMTVTQNCITCQMVEKKISNSRLIFYADGVEFWYRGALMSRFDQAANVAMNAMIEIGRLPRELRTKR